MERVTYIAFLLLAITLLLLFSVIIHATASPSKDRRPGSTTMVGVGCFALDSVDVQMLPHGYLVISRNLFVEYDLTRVSGDDDFWLCTSPAGGISLFRPPDPAEEEDYE